MGLNAPSGMELAATVASGSFTSGSGTASNTNVIMMLGDFNATISGTWTDTASTRFQLQRSFDGGSTFVPAVLDSAGAPATYAANVSVAVSEKEPGVYYRWQPTVTVSTGTANWRISGGDRKT